MFIKILLLLQFACCISLAGKAFGVLTHEAVVDAEWDKQILPLLKEKYSDATADQLQEAHAYAYGGAVAPDMGYYPRGSKFFTDLVHYVRSGDMVNALLHDAQNLDQYAFALGFLSHYEADNYGHPLGTNRSVTLVYTDLQKKYGHYITYAQDELAHVRMEFGFDVLEVAKGNYVSQSYREFIGFKVDTAVLSQAFKETYGLDINDIFDHHFSRSVETFRWIVANVFPLITRAAWAQKKAYIKEHNLTATSKSFHFKMKRRNYDKEFGTGYRKPGFFPGLLSFFLRIVPKIGPLRALKFKAPVPQAEKYFDESFDSVLHYYTADLNQIKHQSLTLADIDFDTGAPAARCEYPLADDTYYELVMKLGEENFLLLTPALQRNIISFYGKENASAGQMKRCLKFYDVLNKLELNH